VEIALPSKTALPPCLLRSAVQRNHKQASRVPAEAFLGGRFQGIRLLAPQHFFKVPRQVKLPNPERVFIDIAKLRDYSLSPQHKEGRHKARVFAAALGLGVSDAEWLGERLKEALREQECQLGKKTPYGQRYVIDFGLRRGEKAARLRSVWNMPAPIHLAA
jgi:hypothetical protein